MQITGQGRKRVTSADFAQILDWMVIQAPNGSEAEALAGVRRFVAAALCSRNRIRNFSDSEVSTFMASNVRYLDNISKAALRRVHNTKLQARKQPYSLSDRITQQQQMLDRLTTQGFHISLAAADARIVEDMDNPTAGSERTPSAGIANPAVSWTSPQITSGVHVKRSSASI